MRPRFTLVTQIAFIALTQISRAQLIYPAASWNFNSSTLSPNYTCTNSHPAVTAVSSAVLSTTGSAYWTLDNTQNSTLANHNDHNLNPILNTDTALRLSHTTGGTGTARFDASWAPGSISAHTGFSVDIRRGGFCPLRFDVTIVVYDTLQGWRTATVNFSPGSQFTWGRFSATFDTIPSLAGLSHITTVSVSYDFAISGCNIYLDNSVIMFPEPEGSVPAALIFAALLALQTRRQRKERQDFSKAI